jgi:hypothetical protein
MLSTLNRADADLVERHRIIPLRQVSELTSISVDCLKRNYADKIKRLSPRRVGMLLADALAIGGQD